MYQPSGVSSESESRGEVTSGASTGTSVTSGGSSNTKGSWVDLGSVTSFAYEALTVVIQDVASQNGLWDIGISDGSNRFVLIPDLYLAGIRVSNEQGFILTIPVHVPAGAQLSARWQASSASQAGRCHVIGHASGLGGAPGFSRVVSVFTPQTGSIGTAVDPGGTANTKGAWAQLVASASADIAGMFGFIGYNADTARAAAARALIDIGVGASSSEFVLYPNALVGWGATRDGPSNCPRIPPFACRVPSGTRIAARAACSTATAGDRTFDLALYGLVA